MNKSYADYCAYHTPTLIYFNKNDIELDFSVLEHPNTTFIPVCYTQSGIDKIKAAKFKGSPNHVAYVTDDMIIAPHSFILLKSEFKTYEIDAKLLYSLYLKNKIELDSISLLFRENPGVRRFYGREIPDHTVNNKYTTAYIDTLEVNYIKP